MLDKIHMVFQIDECHQPKLCQGSLYVLVDPRTPVLSDQKDLLMQLPYSPHAVLFDLLPPHRSPGTSAGGLPEA